MKAIFAGLTFAFAALTLAGCGSTPQALAPTAVDIAASAAPSTLPVINATCPAVQQGLADIAAQLHGGALNTVTQAQATAASSCTEAGKLQLAANDAAPVSAANSGNSAAWLTTLLADAATAAKLAMVVAPLL